MGAEDISSSIGPTSAAPRAVFLSYARDDAESARRIADALRAFGIEVWFDQNELRGGDAWDAKIKKQIRECALFVAVISATTQARGEGYFRREWKLAVERTHDMAAHVAFLLPVVIDDTAESAAIVPDEFIRIHWTRLPGALPTPEFIAQVKRLLEGPTRPDAGRDRLLPPGSGSKTAGSGDPVLQKKRVPAWIWMALGVVAIGLAATFVVVRKPAAVALPPPAAAPTLAANDKSIAVLPFDNDSPDPANAFFTDGIHEDILTNLSNISELRVVSRTSVEQYRHTTKPLKQIGAELGVAYILEGSVERVGNRVHVTGQLIDARTDTHLWAKSYDKDLNDVFAIQAELAQAIAGELQTALSPQEKYLIDRRPTEVPAAYDLYLRARELSMRPTVARVSNGDYLEQQVTLLQEAVKRDPKFVEAWADLAGTHIWIYASNTDRSAARLAKAKAAIDQIVRLAPDSPPALGALAYYYGDGEGNYSRAAELCGKLAHLQPNSSFVYWYLGVLHKMQGRWPDALANLRRATQLDPANVQIATTFMMTLHQCRRFDEELAEHRRILARWPERIDVAMGLASLEDRLDGTSRATDVLLARLAANESNRARILFLRKNRAAARGDYAEFIRLDRQQPYFDPDGGAHYAQALDAAIIYQASGDAAAARERLGNFPAELRRRLANEPANPALWQNLGLMEAVLGNNEDAVRCARKAVELAKESPDADRGPMRTLNLASVYAWAGDKDRAIAELTRYLQSPGYFSGRSLKTLPQFIPLRDDPRFEALLNDPKYNQPLF